MGMWGECFIYFFLTFQWSPWRIMWRLWNGCKTVGWWLHLERTMESSKPLIQFCGWTTCKQTTLVFTNALSLLTVDVKFSHLENWGWEVPLLLFPCLIFQFEELLKKSRQILSRNQNINKNSGADWSVRYLRGKTIIKKKIEIEIEKLDIFSCFSDILPTLSYSFIDQTVQPGPLVSLKCSASGNPTPRISWTLDGYDLPQKDRYFFIIVLGQDTISVKKAIMKATHKATNLTSGQ